MTKPRQATTAVLSTTTAEHVVRVRSRGPGTLVCTDCPPVEPGATFGLRLNDEGLQKSYLYRAQVSWVEHVCRDGQPKVGLALMASPLILRWRRPKSSSPKTVLALESKLAA